jgi:hypothetical protein
MVQDQWNRVLEGLFMPFSRRTPTTLEFCASAPAPVVSGQSPHMIRMPFRQEEQSFRGIECCIELAPIGRILVIWNPEEFQTILVMNLFN